MHLDNEKQPATAVKNNVLPLTMDAGFFFERALSSLDRYRYDKALKYFGKAVEYEPKNPVNHCNMAGILSEMGDYAASNAALLHVLEEIDPEMTECYFYIANNYANMELFEDAEEALVHYLEKDKNGQFLEEAKDMMELLQYELNRPTKLSQIKSREGVYEHEKARKCLETGHFSQAINLLEDITQKQPDFLAALNNLALAYYYRGDFEAAHAAIANVLDQDDGNLHALCNLAIFYQHQGETIPLLSLIENLRKIVPFHQEHVFKLATTMGILGQHEIAYGHFRRLLRTIEHGHDPNLIHYAAAAACNTGRYEVAKKLWLQIEKLDPAHDTAQFYLSQLEVAEHGQGLPIVSYHYQLPFEEQFKDWESVDEWLPSQVDQNPLLRSSLFWALRHSDRPTKIGVVQLLGKIGDEEVKLALQELLLDPNEDMYVKDLVLFTLRSMGVNKVVPFHDGNTIEMVSTAVVKTTLPLWKKEWQGVLDVAFEHLANRGDLEQQHDVETLWVQFLTLQYPNIPTIQSVQGWAAALDYLISKVHQLDSSYQMISTRYGVSASTVRRYVERIDTVCQVKQKIAEQMFVVR